MCAAQRQILSRGSGPSGSLNLAPVGSLLAVTLAAGETISGVRAKHPAAKSSTMKGAKALGSKPSMETVPNSEKPTLVSNGVLLVSTPRNRTLCGECGKYGRAGAWHIECGAEVGPPSDVTNWVKPSLIREGALLPPVVRRCLERLRPLIGNEVIQRQRTGRVAQVEVAKVHGGLSASKATARQWWPCSRIRLATEAKRDNERADGVRSLQRDNPTSTTTLTKL